MISYVPHQATSRHTPRSQRVHPIDLDPSTSLTETPKHRLDGRAPVARAHPSAVGIFADPTEITLNGSMLDGNGAKLAKVASCRFNKDNVEHRRELQ